MVVVIMTLGGLMLNLAIAQQTNTNSIVPTVSIKEPANKAAINAMSVDVQGTFTANNLKQIRVISALEKVDMSANINSNTFDAQNIFVGQGKNTITAIAEDVNGKTSTNSIVIMAKLPSDNPETVWKHMIARLKADDVKGAMSDFGVASKDKYQEAYQSLSKSELLSTIKDMEKITPASIEGDQAQYYFESVVQGQTITFPVEFDKEDGQWKIMEY